MREMVKPYTNEDYYADVMRVCEGRSDPDLLQTMVSESLTTIKWLRALGHQWTPCHKIAGKSMAVVLNGGGARLSDHGFEVARKLGVNIRYQNIAMELIRDARGRVIGVYALTPEGFTRIYGKAVILASGGFEADPAMRRQGQRRAIRYRGRLAHGMGHRRPGLRQSEWLPRNAAGYEPACIQCAYPTAGRVSSPRLSVEHIGQCPWAALRRRRVGFQTLHVCQDRPGCDEAAAGHSIPDPRQEDRAFAISVYQSDGWQSAKPGRTGKNAGARTRAVHADDQ